MYKTMYSLIAILLIGAAGTQAQRQMMGTPPPIEPSSLSIIPTAHVTRSLDLDLSGIGVFLGEGTSLSSGAAKLGVGDIAEIEISTMEIISSLEKPNQLKSIPGGGLKVAFPVWRNWQGVAASFRRSGTRKESMMAALGDSLMTYREKAGEFCVLATVANFASPEEGRSASGGWKGTKVKGHFGLNYLDARMNSGEVERRKSFLRPFGGVEVWRGDASLPQTRVMAEFGWAPHFKPENQGQIEDVWVAMGGIRFFYHRYGTFDIGVRYQSNYEGLSESTLQARLRLGWPTHLIRDRIIGI